MNNCEENRIKEEYTRRDNLLPWNDWKTNIYHPRHPLGKIFTEHNHSILIDSLNALDLDLEKNKILDVGCGYGTWLMYMVELGAFPENCFGVDLSDSRIKIAKHKNPSISWYQQNIDKLPFNDEIFDFVMQTVVFSSILDLETRISSASEMSRVTKNGGLIFWIDLVHPESEKLIGFSEKDVRMYFPRMEIVYRRRVHPKYFRWLNGKFAWLAQNIYNFSDYGCESQLFIFRKPINE